MAHFAYVKDGIVQRVEPVVNEVIATDKGNDSELKGKRFMVSLYPDTLESEWIQCSYNANMRGIYPSHGSIWDGTNFSEPTQTISPALPILKTEKDAAL
ncbi:hypothetical protein UFOVP1213_4 [uncultured Caudovirales phage]|uniref:Uncharacterized protein n=1 Tax=uncultured Caudovirales phage TaxID=2100421 RepID=A0A6J5R2Q7_9CAUD|nr:hypothetical protein UFOVP1213_4 [uncultured Caudovirales phage]